MSLTRPYATSAQVAMLIPNLMNGNTDFDDSKTNPKKSQVDQYLNWISTQIDMQFSQAGYVLPLTTLDGETWPTYQTEYLALVCSMGAAALTGGHVLKPAPALSPSKGSSSGNIYQDMYNEELKKIFDSFSKISSIRFRAKYYASTPAEKSIIEPYGPNIDFLSGDMNPEDFSMLEQYTNLKYNITRQLNLITNDFKNVNEFNYIFNGG